MQRRASCISPPNKNQLVNLSYLVRLRTNLILLSQVSSVSSFSNSFFSVRSPVSSSSVKDVRDFSTSGEALKIDAYHDTVCDQTRMRSRMRLGCFLDEDEELSIEAI